MPLEESLPKIDNRRYDDIMAEVRTRIARYTPEWTPVWSDVNENDPGITMVEVFAWMADMLLYRMGQVPELNYLKFLQLLGVELRPAQPARAEITFPVLDSFSEPTLIVPLHTQVAAESADGELLVFETERALTAIRASLASLQVFDGYAYAEMTETNELAEQGFDPFGRAVAGSALMLGFEDDGDFPGQVELNLTVWVDSQAAATTFTPCGLQSASSPWAELKWQYWNGAEWAELTLLKDETLSLSQDGHVLLKTPPAGLMHKASLGAVADARYWVRALLTRSFDESSPKVLAVRCNTVTALQARSVNDEVLGGSDGSPDQTFQLQYAPVLEGTLGLEVEEGDEDRQWSQKEDFFASSAGDPHFTLNRTTGEIRFGDGINGAIPVGNVENPAANVVARRYRYGGGSAGNVGAGSLTTILTPVEGVDQQAVSNLREAYGGRDEETLDEAKKRAPQTLKNKCRAVTAEDFQQLAMEAGNVRRAKALPLYHPDFPETEIPGVVTVIVVPDSDKPNPVPSRGTLKTVCSYLNDRRLLTTEVYVIEPTYVEVSVEVEVVAEDDADLAEVVDQVQSELLKYFHPLEGGEDGEGWPFGGDVFFSMAYRRVLTVEGVRRVRKLLMTVGGEAIDECKDVTIADGALVFSTEHQVRAEYETG